MTYRFPGAITMENASASLAACSAAIDAGESTLSLADVVRADSSAVAVLIAARRYAERGGRSLTFEAVPATVRSLATLYGVDGFIAAAPESPPARAV